MSTLLGDCHFAPGRAPDPGNEVDIGDYPETRVHGFQRRVVESHIPGRAGVFGDTYIVRVLEGVTQRALDADIGRHTRRHNGADVVSA